MTYPHPVLFYLQVWVHQFGFIKSFGFSVVLGLVNHYWLMLPDEKNNLDLWRYECLGSPVWFIWKFGFTCFVLFECWCSSVLFFMNIWVPHFCLMERLGSPVWFYKNVLVHQFCLIWTFGFTSMNILWFIIVQSRPSTIDYWSLNFVY